MSWMEGGRHGPKKEEEVRTVRGNKFKNRELSILTMGGSEMARRKLARPWKRLPIRGEGKVAARQKAEPYGCGNMRDRVFSDERNKVSPKRRKPTKERGPCEVCQSASGGLGL